MKLKLFESIYYNTNTHKVECPDSQCCMECPLWNSLPAHESCTQYARSLVIDVLSKNISRLIRNL